MIITCPKCGTQYSVDRVGFGQTAKTVRCFSCQNQWLQQPVVQPRAAPPQYQMPPQMPGAYPGYPPPGYPPPGYPPPGYPPPGYPQMDPAHNATGTPAAPAQDPNYRPEGPSVLEDDHDADMPQLTAGIDALFGSDDDDDDDDLDLMDGINLDAPDLSDLEDIPGEITPAKDPDLSQDDLDSLFDEDEDTDTIGSMVESTGDDDDSGNFENFDDIPDPEPLPESLTSNLSDDDDDEGDAPKPRRGGKKKVKRAQKGNASMIIALVLIILFGGLSAGMFLLRDMVVNYVPALSAVYELVGLNSTLGEGLEIQDVNSERGTDNGIDFLMLSGNIANMAEGPKPVPLIKAMLIDAEGEIIQSVVQEPAAMEIQGGEVLGFSVKIDEPSPLARRL